MKKIDFNKGWEYFMGDKADAVRLPHDAMLLAERTPDSPGGQALAHFTGGVYKYQKCFTAPAEWKDQSMILEFEGVYRNASVVLNGHELARHCYGYTPFYVDISSALKCGGENILTVNADNSKIPNSRWYTGGGIYRPVWLYIGERSHILPGGIKVSTVSYMPAQIQVEVEYSCHDVQESDIDIEVEIYRKGRKAAAAKGNGEGKAIIIDIPDADLWSEDTPNLYECRAILSVGGKTADMDEVSFGIRKLEWSPEGFLVNGKNTLLRGGCIHHDNGILGAASYAESEERRVRILKENGFNAVRSAHNPISTAMLDACDRYGIYVMDEAWDMWYKPKMKHDYALDFDRCWQEDLESMVRRDYSHPSVVMYSIGNEVSEPAEAQGINLAQKLVAEVHRLDASRPVTCGLNLMILNTAAQGKAVSKADSESGKEEAAPMPTPTDSTSFNMMAAMIGQGMNRATASPEIDKAVSPLLDLLDIGGYNYASGRYPLDSELHPDRVIVGSETFPQDIARNWEMVKKYPYLIGDFMWTAWDYLGEAGIGAWTYHKDGCTFDKPFPWLLADTGAIDILGHPGAEAVYAKIVWGLRKEPYIGVIPPNHSGEEPYKATWRGTNAVESWCWKGCEGNTTTVEVYADAHMVELTLNGNLIGKKEITDFKAEFELIYEPGLLTATAYDSDGNKTASSSLQSGNGIRSVRLTPEKPAINPNGIVYVDVDIVYENGVTESNMDMELAAEVDGGELLGFGSAQPHTHESYLSGHFTTYYGRAQAIVKGGGSGCVSLAVKALDGMETRVEIPVGDDITV